MKTIPLIRDNGSEYCIVAENSPPAKFAAEELQRYLQKSTGVTLPISDTPAAKSLALTIQAPSQKSRNEFSIHVDRETIQFSGQSPISLVYAVYHFLETFAGVAFYSPEYEYVPEQRTIDIPAEYRYQQAARFAVRQISTEWCFNEAMVDWAVKNRFNCICASMAFWRGERGGEVVEAARKRGMSIGLTGHVLFELLKSDDYFQDHPECYPEIDGVRTPTRHSGDNICYSNPHAVAMLAENLKRFCDQFPLLSSVSLWPGDGGWVCKCPECRKVSFTTSYGLAVARVAEILRQSHPHVTVGQLAYNFLTPDLSLDMFQIPPALQHVPTMFAFWGQDLTKPWETNSDEKHQTVLRHLEEYCRAGLGQAAIFSYHTDTYMNSNLCPIFEPAMSADFQLFQKMGLDQVCLLWIPWNDLNSDVTLWIARQNGCLYGRCAMDEHFDIEHYREEYLSRAFGQDHAEYAKAIWNALNESLRPLFELTWASAPYRFSDAWGCGFCRSVLKWELSTDYGEVGKRRLAKFHTVASYLDKHHALLRSIESLRLSESIHLHKYYEHCLQRTKGLTFLFQAQYAMQAGSWPEAARLLQNAIDTGMESEKEQTLDWLAFCQEKMKESH